MDNRGDSRHSYDSNQQIDDNRDRRDDSYYTNRNRNYDRPRRWDRDRRRSRSRSPPSRGRGDRDRDRRYDGGTDRVNDVPAQNRYHEDYSHQREGSSRFERSDDRHRPEQDWRLKLTNIRDAHFNRSKQAPSVAQNQFTNDGSFLEKFKQMAGESSSCSSVMPNSLALASSSIQFDSEISLPPLTTIQATASLRPSTSKEDDNEDLDGVPIKRPIPVPVPVSIGRRRTAKPLKTGVVFKKKQPEEDEPGEEKLDTWFLNAVQKYKQQNCVEEDSNRPLVK